MDTTAGHLGSKVTFAMASVVLGRLGGSFRSLFDTAGCPIEAIGGINQGIFIAMGRSNPYFAVDVAHASKRPPDVSNLWLLRPRTVGIDFKLTN